MTLVYQTFSAPALSGSVVVPADTAVFGRGNGKLIVNGIDGYCMRAGLMPGVIDPRWPFSRCDGAIETQGPAVGVSQAVASTAEVGIVGPDAVMRFGKVADPDDAAKFAYIMRRKQGDEGTLKRTELSFSPTFTPIPLAANCWIGFATRIPSTWRAMTGTDEVMLWQVHETPDGGDDTQPAPIGMVVKGDRQMMWVRSNPNAATFVGGTTYTEVFSEAAWPGDQWQFWAFKLKSHWDNAQSPRFEAWRRVGSGATVKVIDYSGPNSYNNTVRDYVKSGLYYYAEQWTGSLTDKVLYHKGLYQWLDGQGVDEELILDYLQSI